MPDPTFHIRPPGWLPDVNAAVMSRAETAMMLTVAGVCPDFRVERAPAPRGPTRGLNRIVETLCDHRHDISGVIEEVGSHVSEFRVGDAVYYTPRIFGGPSYAEQHVARRGPRRPQAGEHQSPRRSEPLSSAERSGRPW